MFKSVTDKKKAKKGKKDITSASDEEDSCKKAITSDERITPPALDTLAKTQLPTTPAPLQPAESDRTASTSEDKPEMDDTKTKKTRSPTTTEEPKPKVDKKKGDKKEKTKRDKKEEEQRRLVEENVDENEEIAELESTKTGDDSPKDYHKEVYNLFPDGVFVAYDKIKGFARDLNTQIAHPEVVLLGPTSHGKSSLLEAIIGRQFNTVGLGGVSKRPLFLNMSNNLDCAEPRVTLKRDLLIHGSGFDRDTQLSFDQLGSELQKRQEKAGKEPIFVHYEHKGVTNITFIDTPGIPDEDAHDYESIVEMVTNLAKPANRILICVEEAADWSKMRMMKLIKSVDPDLSRTIFAHTKFHTHTQLFTSLSAVNRYLSGIVPEAKTFFVSIPSLKVRQKQATAESYQEKIWQAYRRDMNTLEQLQYDKRFERNIGIHALRKTLLNTIWKNYQEGVPEVLKALRSRKTVTEQSLEAMKKQTASLDACKLRSIANQHVVEFLQVIEKLIEGTSEGNPTVTGQTMEEEKSAQGDIEWVDAYNHIITLPEKSTIPFHASKVYGGQQFERLLAEFKSVCDHTDIAEVTMDDVATAAGINKVNNVPNYAWAASDLAQHQSQEAFLPLIDQLSTRAVYVMKRLYDISDKIISSRKKNWPSDRIDVENIELYPYFTNHVKDLFTKFIDQSAKQCKEHCMDEFYSSKTIFWELTEFASDKKLITDRTDKNPEEVKQAVAKLASELFKNIRERITKNVMLKFYNFFLVPMQTQLWNEIQKKIATLSDSDLEQYFQAKAIKDKLKEDEKNLETLLKKTVEQETQFVDQARQFAHPILSKKGPSTVANNNSGK